MEDRKRKIILTNIFGIVAIIIALVVIYLSTGELPAEAVIWGGMIVVLLIAVTAVKTGKKKEYNYAGAVVGGIMIVAGLVLSAFSYSITGETAGSGLLTGGIILFVICFISLRKSADSDIRDERSLKIGTWAISYSWYLTFLVVIVMFWLSYLDLVAIDAFAALGILIMLMPLSTVAFQWYFSRKGDVY
jgi:peptidoglycan/LPS O-acetylase OafA/YrhL